MADTGWYEVPYDDGVFHERIVGRTEVPSAFRVIEDQWEDSVPPRRTIHKLDVHDSTPADVTFV